MENEAYIDAICNKDELGTKLPLEEPNYDEESDLWELWFEYTDYDNQTDLVCLNFEKGLDAIATIRRIKNERAENQKKLQLLKKVA